MFCGLGAGKGWNTFKFVSTPEEFESLFVDYNYHFVITNSRVEIDYKETEKQAIFLGYQTFFDEILIVNRPFNRKIHWQIESKIRISVTDNLNKISFKEISDEKLKNEFKLVRPMEPTIGISPFYLYLTNENDYLSVAYDNEEGIIGLEFTFPKFVSFEEDNYSNYHETIDFSTFNLYENLLQRVKKIAKKAKVKSEHKLFKPNFWISPNAVKVINENHYLKSKSLTIL